MHRYIYIDRYIYPVAVHVYRIPVSVLIPAGSSSIEVTGTSCRSCCVLSQLIDATLPACDDPAAGIPQILCQCLDLGS